MTTDKDTDYTPGYGQPINNCPAVKRYGLQVVCRPRHLPMPEIVEKPKGEYVRLKDYDLVVKHNQYLEALLQKERTKFSFAVHLQRQREFSERTFGPGRRTAGVCDHIRKELIEIESAPEDVTEWIDVVILALDGAWRTGATPEQIISALVAKQTKNESRTWPDWRTVPMDKAIEHKRSSADPAQKE